MTISTDRSGPGATAAPGSAQPLVLIVGAGISGLLLAQHLKREGIPYRIFERDADLETRGTGWGLTLHWSLAALQSLLPSELAQRICDESSVDRRADRRGEASRFPFFNLDSGELKAQTPGAVKSARIRVMRQRLRKLLAEGIEVEWGKTLREFHASDNGIVSALFEDGTSCTGTLLVACDGGQSRVRRALFPDESKLMVQLPVRTMGVKISLTAEQIEPIRKLDLFFLQGGSPSNNSFTYFSVLDVPGNQVDSDPDLYSCQMHVSWPYAGSGTSTDVPATNKGRYELMHAYAKTWSEPFRSLVLNNVHPETEIKRLDVLDWAPPLGLRSKGQVVLMGDAFHLMSMYRGEGANHAIVDVLDFATHVVPLLSPDRRFSPTTDSQQLTDQNQGLDFRRALRQALDRYEDAVVSRARPGVLASRRACLDAHAYSRLFGEAATGVSPLLSKREMMLQFDDESAELLK
ncbi:FAD/NAD(P)-binding domain-containing protein [Trichoderma citrinoviride]|uniref:FAD/NAD(P)-binding domain-containing protein n=1 Tax=Trichoderma citrinoviride TaxID=58853 RepID=A0A2T4BIG9_9HYPO|nr:FAD/NAD(P)-binding domain-containing protein [Trichoderma citrinoviride]PTB69114.1 FAD/NAD(P)-binding domain-containing protein [Trichoderma citrinoviride]